MKQHKVIQEESLLAGGGDEKHELSMLMLNENDDLKQQVHTLRLKNAELRNEVNRAKREH